MWDAVVVDIDRAIPLVREGGFLCGDDLELQANEVDAAEMQIAISERVEMIRDTASGQIYHPGVAFALARMFPKLSVNDGFWHVRKTRQTWDACDIDSRCPIPAHLLAWS